MRTRYRTIKVFDMRNPEVRQASGEAVLVKAYSLHEIADIYGVGRKTLRKWLAPFEAEIGRKNGRFYSVNQVRIIFARLGVPGRLSTDSSITYIPGMPNT